MVKGYKIEGFSSPMTQFLLVLLFLIVFSLFKFLVKIKFVRLLLLCSFVWSATCFCSAPIFYLLGVIANFSKCDSNN